MVAGEGWRRHGDQLLDTSDLGREGEAWEREKQGKAEKVFVRVCIVEKEGMDIYKFTSYIPFYMPFTA